MEKELFKNDNIAVVASISEAGAKLSVVAQASLGGGELAGAVQAKSSNEVDLSVKQLLDVAAMAAEAKFPSVAPLIAAAVAELEALIAKA